MKKYRYFIPKSPPIYFIRQLTEHVEDRLHAGDELDRYGEHTGYWIMPTTIARREKEGSYREISEEEFKQMVKINKLELL